MCKELPNLSLEQLEKGNVLAAIVRAAKKGIVEFITAVLTVCPELVWSNEISTERSLYMFAVLHRQSEVFRLVCKSPAKNSIFARADNDSNSILHIAAMFEPSARHNTVPGAAFLMQREIQWYKVIIFYFISFLYRNGLYIYIYIYIYILLRKLNSFN